MAIGMAGKVKPRDIGTLIEIRKRIAELEYKKGYLERMGSPDGIKDIEEELAMLRERGAVLEKKAAGMAIFVPFQNKVEELGAKVAAKAPEEVDGALRSRSGELYGILNERGKVLKANLEARNEIGKLVLLVHRMNGEMKGKVIEAVKEGKVPEGIGASELGENAGKVVSALNRSGIGCRVVEDKLVSSEEPWGEEKVSLNNSYVWIPKEKVDSFRQNETEMEKVGIKLQVKNAERQVKDFSEEEMKDFQDLQNRYMGLLRARKEITDGYERELGELEMGSSLSE
jgi:hypothetical protein